MSRIGKQPVSLKENVEATVTGNTITIKGPNGELSFNFHEEMDVQVEGSEIVIKRPSDSKQHRSVHGTTRAIINNLVEGVTAGFKKELKLIGVGYRAMLQGKKLVINAGYSNPVEMIVPEGITLEVPKNTQIIVKGANKQQVGAYAAEIRKVRPPEPYLGKGIRYVDEHVRRKEGKTALTTSG
ncbi:MAG: 50S ribosomal protein L6 [Candidatus Izimaplasma sp.]|nr:50S ribosomal protein L6 [Candidatus Izimaplasma bacterium]